MDVSIIVIASNVRDEVVRCLDSIERHSGSQQVETILVDNGSSDGTTDAVAASHSGVTVIRRPTNEGVAARNHGLRVARGRFRMFLDSDALLTPGALDDLVSFLEARPDVGLVGPRLLSPNGRVQPSARRFPPLLTPLLRRPPLGFLFENGAAIRWHLMLDDPPDTTREVEYVLGACQLFTEEAQHQAGEIDPRIFYGPDDADWCFRIRSAGLKVFYRPEAAVIHDYRRSTVTRPFSLIAWRHLRSFYRFQWNWRRGRSRLLAEGAAMDLRASVAANADHATFAPRPLLASRPSLAPSSASGLDSRRGSANASPEVSVVIVAWRAREDVLRCLASLKRHAGVSYEAIVVDDGSGDGTPEAVSRRFPTARILAKPRNEGLVAGRNSALALVRGRLVLMLDADTEVTPGALATLAARFDDPEVGLVGPKLLYPDGQLQLSCRRYPGLLLPFLRRGPYARLDADPPAHRRHLMKDFDHDQERPVAWVAGAAQMWRAELPDAIGPYDSRISSYGGEDLDWCLRVWAAGLEVRYVPTAEIVHVWQQLTRASPYGRKSFRQLRDFYYLQWKHRRLRRDGVLEEANA